MRQLLLAVGSCSTALGLGLLVAPGLARGLGWIALVGAVVVVLLVGGTVATVRVSAPRERPTPPRAGEGIDAAVPGEAFDRKLISVPAYSDRGANQRAAVRERLRPIALDYVVQQVGCTREQARDRLDTGTWTDNPVAARLFTDAEPSTGAKLRSLIGGKSAFQRRVERAIAVLAEEGTDD